MTDRTVTTDELFPAAGHHSLRSYLRMLVERRAYLWHVPRNELAAQQADTALGSLWHLLNPILLTLNYYLIFGVILHISRGVDNYITFLTIGVFVFHFSQRSVTGGASSIVGNVGLIRAIQFPRALLPLSVVMKQLLLYLPAIAVVLVTALLTGEAVTLRWLLLPLAVLLQLVMNGGFSLVAARLTHSVPDVENVLPFAFRLAFYASGVLFSVEQRAGERWLWLFRLNPFYDIIEIHRAIIMGTSLHLSVVVSAVLWAVVGSIVGMIWFHRDEAFYGARN